MNQVVRAVNKVLRAFVEAVTPALEFILARTEPQRQELSGTIDGLKQVIILEPFHVAHKYGNVGVRCIS